MLVGLAGVGNQRGAGRPIDFEMVTENLVGPAQLVARWPLHTDGTEIVNGLDLTPTGTPTFVSNVLTPLPTPGSVELDGSTQWFSRSHDALLALTELSIVAWFQPFTVHDGAIWSKDVTGIGAGHIQEGTLRCYADGSIGYFWDDGTGALSRVISAPSFYTANDIICAVVILGPNGGASLHLNRQQVDTEPDWLEGLDQNTEDLVIGRNGAGIQEFNGRISNVLMYSGRLTNADVLNITRLPPIASAVEVSAEPSGSDVVIDLRNQVQAGEDATFSVSNITQNFGTMVFDGDHEVTYSPGASDGSDTFDYTVTDKFGSDTASATVTVGAGNTGDPVPVSAQWFYKAGDISDADIATFNSEADTHNTARVPDGDNRSSVFDATNSSHTEMRFGTFYNSPFITTALSGDIPKGALYIRRTQEEDGYYPPNPDPGSQLTGVAHTMFRTRNVNWVTQELNKVGFDFYIGSNIWNDTWEWITMMSISMGGQLPFIRPQLVPDPKRLKMWIRGSSQPSSSHAWENSYSFDITTVQPNKWHRLLIEFVADNTGNDNGSARIEFDGSEVFNQTGLRLGNSSETTLISEPQIGQYNWGFLQGISSLDPHELWLDFVWLETNAA